MRTDRLGQAATEFAIGVFLLATILAFLTGIAPVLVRALELQSTARSDAGLAALNANEGDDYSTATASTLMKYTHPNPPVDVPNDLTAMAGDNTDPWTYPIEKLPDALPLFAPWRDNAVTPLALIPGSASQEFHFRMIIGGETAVDGKGRISAEVKIPPMRLQ